MQENIIELHSSRAKRRLNLYLLKSIFGVLFLIYLPFSSLFKGLDHLFFLIIIMSILTFLNIWIYTKTFLGYLNKNENLVILKKPFLNKEWNIKLENITNIDKERILTYRKYIKIQTFNKDKTDTKDYYILPSSLTSFIIDDVKILKKSVQKRKQELSN